MLSVEWYFWKEWLAAKTLEVVENAPLSVLNAVVSILDDLYLN